MPGALDAFRAQQEAADAVRERLQEVSVLVRQLRAEVDALARDDKLKRVLQREETWLAEARRSWAQCDLLAWAARRTVAEVRYWREREAQRFWSGVVRRWLVAAVFAVASAAAAGAAYARVTEPYQTQPWVLRDRMEFVEYVEHRVITMSAAERRQFDALMRWPSEPNAQGRR